MSNKTTCHTVGDLYSWLHERLHNDPAIALSALFNGSIVVSMNEDSELVIQQEKGSSSFVDFDADALTGRSGRL